MPADVSFRDISASSVSIETRSSRRLPLGIGLIVAGSASVALWVAVAVGFKAVFF
jgi:hypothetical protein